MEYGVLYHVNSIMATPSLFTWNRSQLEQADAICIDLDRSISDNDLESCFQWIDHAEHKGLQVLVIGSRENLLSVPELKERAVTFIEKREELAGACGEQQAEIANEILDKVYAPFTISGAGYVNQEGSSMPQASCQLQDSEKAIDPAYLQPVLTDEQRKALFAFLGTPEGQDDFLPPGVENA